MSFKQFLVENNTPKSYADITSKELISIIKKLNIQEIKKISTKRSKNSWVSNIIVNINTDILSKRNSGDQPKRIQEIRNIIRKEYEKVGINLYDRDEFSPESGIYISGVDENGKEVD